MTCEGCVRAVTRAIQAAAPQARITVDLKSQTAELDDGVPEAIVAAAINGSGFKFLGKA